VGFSLLVMNANNTGQIIPVRRSALLKRRTM